MGFHRIGTEANGAIDGKLKTFNVDAAHATVLGPGDVVRITGTASADGTPEVDTGVAATANTGVIAAVRPNYAGEQLSITHLPASTAGTVEVNVDAFCTYEVAVVNGPLVVANVGLNIALDNTAGTVTGSVFTSNMAVDASTVATTATLPFTVVELRDDEAGVLGNRALVRVNATPSKAGGTGI